MSELIEESSPRLPWTRWICFILLLATLLNYANRFAFTQNAVPVQTAFDTGQGGYGDVAGYFSLGFALGGLTFGILADVISIRLLYPAVVIIWSLAGLSTGLVTELFGLKVCQFLLGLFEAGHWPCALRTTQRLLLPHQRTLGNSILQSGASLGAVLTPLLVLAVYRWDPEQWRLSFFIVGGLGLPWAILWLASVREADVRRPVIQTDEVNPGVGEQRELQEPPFFHIFLMRRYWVLVLVVISINTLWHYIRVWLPNTLEGRHGYSHEFVQWFTSLYYLSTFFGSLASGWLSARLVQQGWNVFRSRLAVFLVFGLLSCCSIPAAFLPKGPLMLAMLLIVAFGSLGLFPVYYSLNQEISAKHQGKVGGSLGLAAWGTQAIFNPIIGRWVEQSPEVRPYVLAAVGIGPLLGFIVLARLWGRRQSAAGRNS